MRRIASIVASSTLETLRLSDAALTASLARVGVRRDLIDRFEVERVLELPQQTRAIASTGGYVAVVVSGIVRAARGYSEDYSMQAIHEGLQRVRSQTGVPVISLVFAQRTYSGSNAERHLAEHWRFDSKRAAVQCARILGLSFCPPTQPRISKLG